MVGAIVDFYGAFDWLMDPSVRNQSDLTPSVLWDIHRFEPVSHLTSACPPMLIAHGKNDQSEDYHQSVELDQMLTAKGVPHELVLLENMGQGFGLTSRRGHLLPRDLRPVILAFLSKYLGTPIHPVQISAP